MARGLGSGSQRALCSAMQDACPSAAARILCTTERYSRCSCHVTRGLQLSRKSASPERMLPLMERWSAVVAVSCLVRRHAVIPVFVATGDSVGFETVGL